MSLLFASWLAAFGPADPSVGLVDPNEGNDPIIGGDPTDPGEFDHVVAIYWAQNLCTGTLVSPTIVLTAAHCLANANDPQEVTVATGQETLSVDEFLNVQRFGVHPEYCGMCRDFDLWDFGWIELAEPLEFDDDPPRPIVDQDEWDALMREGAEVTLVGYGEAPDARNGPAIEVKRKVTSSVRRFIESGAEFFAGGDGRDTCPGDSGGPAFVRAEDGTWRLAGVLSRGTDPCGDGGYFGVPYPALCWLRDETDLDLLEGTCSDCSCLDTRPPEEGCGCGSGGSAPGGWTTLGWLAASLWLVTRRRALRSDANA